MKIIKLNPSPSGAYPRIIENWKGDIPNGWALVDDSCDTSTMIDYDGFVTLTIVDGIITGFTPDMAAWEAWKAENPEQPPQPGPVTQAEIALAELAETESTHDIENKLALADLAEMIGGTNG